MGFWKQTATSSNEFFFFRIRPGIYYADMSDAVSATAKGLFWYLMYLHNIYECFQICLGRNNFIISFQFP